MRRLRLCFLITKGALSMITLRWGRKACCLLGSALLVSQAALAGDLALTATLAQPTCTLTVDNVTGGNFELPEVSTPSSLLNNQVVTESEDELQLTASCPGYANSQLSLQLTGETDSNDNALFVNVASQADMAKGVGVVAHMSTTQCASALAYNGACSAQADETELSIGTPGTTVKNQKIYVRVGLTAGARNAVSQISTGQVNVPLTFKLRYP